MSKTHHSIKMEKRKPLLTPKEKRAAKKMKKQREHEIAPPLIPH